MRLRRRCKRILIPLGLLLAAVAGAEWAARSLSPTAHPVPDQRGQQATEEREGVTWLVPNYRGRLVSSEFDTAVRTNASGLRGPELSTGMTLQRVLLLGDSFAFGWGVEEGEAFGHLAQTLASQQGAPFELLNGGVPGDGPLQEVVRVKASCPALKPGLVLLEIYDGNDLPDLLFGALPKEVDPALMERLQVVRDRARVRDPWDHLLRERSALYKLFLGLKSRAGSSLGWSGFEEDPFHQYWVPDEARPEALGLLATALGNIDAEARACGSKLAVVIVPSVASIEHARQSEARVKELSQIDAGVRAWAEKAGVPLLDLGPVLRERFARAPTERLYYRFDLHLNARGHAVAAEALAPFLTRTLSAMKTPGLP